MTVTDLSFDGGFASRKVGGMRSNFDDDNRKVFQRLMGALDGFRAIRSTMPLQYVMSFLLVARYEGKSVMDYATMAGVSKSVMSRHLLDIGERSRHMTKGFGLVTYRPSPLELRKHEYFLTDKGRALAHKIIRQLEK